MVLNYALILFNINTISNYVYTYFSSLEHKVLRVSYCDRSLSVVRRRPLCVVRRASCVNFFT